MTNRKLTDEQVVEIREKISKGARKEDVMKEYGIVLSTLNSLISGKSYKEIGGPLTRVTKHKSDLRVLDEQQVVMIRELASKDKNLNELAGRYAVDRSTIRGIVRGRTYQDIGGPITPAKYQRRPAGLITQKLSMREILDYITSKLDMIIEPVDEDTWVVDGCETMTLREMEEVVLDAMETEEE